MNCECGCGSAVKPRQRFVQGHNGRGKKRSPETAAAISKALKSMPKEVRARESQKSRERMLGDKNPLRRFPERCHLIGKTGSAHPKWKGGSKDYRGPEVEWESARERVFARAQGACERCGDELELVVHHKLSPADGVSWDNDDENLEALCRACHAHEHHFGVSKPHKEKR